jgi:hypothetical protein
MSKQIEIQAAQTQTQVLEQQSDFVEVEDTIKEAKARVKRITSKEWQELTEMSEPIRYAQILVDGECLYDYFAKGYNGEAWEAE